MVRNEGPETEREGGQGEEADGAGGFSQGMVGPGRAGAENSGAGSGEGEAEWWWEIVMVV